MRFEHSPDKALSWSWVRLAIFLDEASLAWASLTGGELIGIKELLWLLLFKPFKAECDKERFSAQMFSTWFKSLGMLLALWKKATCLENKCEWMTL